MPTPYARHTCMGEGPVAVPAQMLMGASPVPAQMWRGRTGCHTPAQRPTAGSLGSATSAPGPLPGGPALGWNTRERLWLISGSQDGMIKLWVSTQSTPTGVPPSALIAALQTLA